VPRPRRRPLHLAAATSLLALAGALCACGSGSPTPASGGRVSVVAGENMWGDIASQIGGSHVHVTSIITDPNTDPHVYESDPQDAAEIDNAQLVIVNGAGYDDFVTKTLASDASTTRRVVTVQNVLGVTGSNPNPHFWYWTARLPLVATATSSA
jgi:zinc/manganese transport system substrate-binding protein